MTKGVGQYDLEYARCACFWGTAPGKYVRMVTRHLPSGVVLDLGAGEGKNAIYLASLGFDVVAVECSEYALNNFKSRLQTESPTTRSRIQIIQADVTAYTPTREFDVVIAYGLLHCLQSPSAVVSAVRLMQGSTVEGGYNVVVSFTNSLPVPAVHDYLEPTLLEVGELESFYSSWQLVDSENAVIEEEHPTTKVLHKHSVCRLIARRPSEHVAGSGL